MNALKKDLPLAVFTFISVYMAQSRFSMKRLLDWLREESGELKASRTWIRQPRSLTIRHDTGFKLP
jgi:hypothetical protein